jgi:hypothetical protein
MARWGMPSQQFLAYERAVETSIACHMLTVAFEVHCYCECDLFLPKSPLPCRNDN